MVKASERKGKAESQHVETKTIHLRNRRSGVFVDQWRFAPLQAADDLAQRPDRFAQHDHLAFQAVDGGHRLLPGIGQHLFFEVGDCLPEVFQHDKILAHDGVDQRVGEIVRAHLADAALAVAEAVADGIKHVADVFLKREDEILAEGTRLTCLMSMSPRCSLWEIIFRTM